VQGTIVLVLPLAAVTPLLGIQLVTVTLLLAKALAGNTTGA